MEAKVLTNENNFLDLRELGSDLVIAGSVNLSPALSIIIPTYKRPDLLRQALLSAVNQRGQTRYEIIIVDNNVELDQTSSVCLDIINQHSVDNIWLYRNKINLGMFGNWNRGIQLATSEWITILNDDDMLDDDYIFNMLVLIEKNPDLKLLGCGSRIIDERKNKGGYNLSRTLARLFKKHISNYRLNEVKKLNPLDYFFTNPHTGSLGILMLKDYAMSLGGFNPNLFPSADYIFFTKFNMKYGTFVTKKVMATYRVKENESQNIKTSIGWIKQGVSLRKELSVVLSINKKLSSYYSKLVANDIAESCVKFWGVDIGSLDANENYHNYFKRNRFNTLKLYVMRLLLMMLYKRVE